MSRLNFHVGGMHCAACAAAVERAVRALPGASEVYVNIATNRMTLTADDSLAPETIADTVKKAGFEADLIPPVGFAFRQTKKIHFAVFRDDAPLYFVERVENRGDDYVGQNFVILRHRFRNDNTRMDSRGYDRSDEKCQYYHYRRNHL